MVAHPSASGNLPIAKCSIAKTPDEQVDHEDADVLHKEHHQRRRHNVHHAQRKRHIQHRRRRLGKQLGPERRRAELGDGHNGAADGKPQEALMLVHLEHEREIVQLQRREDGLIHTTQGSNGDHPQHDGVPQHRRTRRRPVGLLRRRRAGLPHHGHRRRAAERCRGACDAREEEDNLAGERQAHRARTRAYEDAERNGELAVLLDVHPLLFERVNLDSGGLESVHRGGDAPVARQPDRKKPSMQEILVIARRQEKGKHKWAKHDAVGKHPRRSSPPCRCRKTSQHESPFVLQRANQAVHGRRDEGAHQQDGAYHVRTCTEFQHVQILPY
mmetsp:Transcript_44158/g.124691  ORF Transcript_44158/g.124691 Transcript_44158/m.124691 type:complete len:329 (+) Transcript_44158:935-1921(+)